MVGDDMDRVCRSLGTTAALGVLVGLAVAQALTAVAGAIVMDMPLGEVVASYMATNLAIAVSFAICGGVLAWYRPRNLVGWLLLGVGLAQGTTAAVTPLLVAGAANDWPAAVMSGLATAYAYGWPWSIGLLLPMSLLVFPDGRLPSRRWRIAVAVIVVIGVGFVVMMGSEPGNVTLGDGQVVTHPLTLSTHADLAGLWAVVGIAVLGNFLAALAALVGRYRRGTEVVRRQLLWLVLGVVGAIVIPLPTTTLGTGPILLILAICLIPTAIAIAVLRHNLLDIRLVVSRAALWLALTAVVIGGYVGLVAVFGMRLADRSSSILAALLVALVFNPLRLWGQGLVDRLFYGHGRDPVRAIARVEDELGRSSDLPGLLEAIRNTLRLPYVALERLDADGDHVVASTGAPRDPGRDLHRVVLTYADVRVADLVVGLRAGERRVRPADARVLDLLAAPLAVAVHATALSIALQQSRERLVEARELERRRLRRDLHDGLGPTLTGVTFKADAARNLLRVEPDRADDLLGSLQADVRDAIADIRRLIHDLRPPALDDLGLLGALRQHADQVNGERLGGLAVGFQTPPALPPLPAAVEVAAYRVTVEALTNAARHARARQATVRLSVGDTLEVEVVDDGPVRVGTWQPGVGLTAMGERVSELGGTLEVGPGPAGGRVLATFPLGTA
jgi:two-component system, NarL family, sensor kinase